MSSEILCYKLLRPGLTLFKEQKLCQPLIKMALQKNVSKHILSACRRHALVSACFSAIHGNYNKLLFNNTFNFSQSDPGYNCFLNKRTKYFSSDKKPPFTKAVSRQDLLRKVLQDKQHKLHETELRLRKSGKLILEDIKERKTKVKEKIEDLHQTELRIRKSGRLILDDIKETKSKMKEKMEEVIQRENIFTIPNVLCVTRIALSPYIGYLIINQDFKLALWIVLFAGVTDLLDGWIARTFKNQSSNLGSFLDPMADKVLIATMFLSLTYAEIIPVPLTSLIITRDVLLVAAGFYIRYQSLPPPRTLSRYFDVTHATAQLAPTTISKVNTMVQLITVACTLAAPVFDYVDHAALHTLWYVTAGTTIASAASYMLTKNTYKYLKDNNKNDDKV